MVQASRADARETLRQRRPRPRPSDRRGHAPRPLGRQPHGRRRATGGPSPMELRTSGAPGHGRTRPRKRRGVPMRTPALWTCAPAKRRKAAAREGSCASRSREARAVGIVRAGPGAIPRPEGLVRHSAECVFTTRRLPSRGRSRTSDPCRKSVQRRFESAEQAFFATAGPSGWRVKHAPVCVRQKSSVRALSSSPASISPASAPAIWSANTCP